VNGLLDVDRYANRVGDFASNYPSSSTHVVHAEYTGTSSYDAVAVYGSSMPADNWGIGGEFYGSYVGVRGMVSLITGGAQYFGMYGRTEGTLGVGGSMYGVRGVAYGFGSSSGTAYGIYGNATGAATNYAGYFSGNVTVTGTLSKGGGGFRIDHPLDPETKYLSHSFVESPDMKNVYDGVVRLDSAGEAWVELPEWFEALNRDFRYQLTCIGGFAPVYVAEELSGNRFKIAGGKAGMKVSWQLTGIRQDKFADANRIPVEEEKPPEHVGRYLHPAAYGHSESMFVNYEALSDGKQK